MRVTKFVVTSQDSDVLPSDIAMKIYESGRNINVKETCFGVIIDGDEDDVRETVNEIRMMDLNHIFIKDRGFPPGDPRRCRGYRGGGARPGFYMIEYESKILPLISQGLASEERGERPVSPPKMKKRLRIDQLEEIINKEFS
ncbi:MAG: methanogenesis marker 6 protein [Methanotrichaceae archaeon]